MANALCGIKFKTFDSYTILLAYLLPIVVKRDI